MEENNPMMDHLAELGIMLNSMRKSNTFTDIILVCDDAGQEVVYSAHKTVLVAASKYFKFMFHQSKDKKHFKLLDVPSDILEILLEFMYSGNLEIPDEIEIRAVLAIANRYHLSHAVRHCANMILKTMSIENVMEFINIAEDYQIVCMKQSLLVYMENNFKKLIDTSTLVQLPFEYLKAVMSSTSLNCSPEEIFEGILKWILYDEVARKEKFDDLSKNIDFSVLSTDYTNKILENPLVVCNDKLMLALLKEFYKRMNGSIFCKPDSSNILYSNENDSITGIYQKYLPYEVTNQDLPEAAIMGFIKNKEGYNLTSLSLTDGLQWYLKDSITLPLFQSFDLPYQAAVCVSKGEIYFIGGTTGETPVNGTALKTVLVYNIKLKEWSFKADMKNPRFGSGCVILDEKIYVLGGCNAYYRCSRSAAYFEISSNIWVDAPAMHVCRLKPAVITFNDYLYVMGGDYQPYENTSMANSFYIGERYQPNNRQWTIITTRLPIGRELQHRCYRMATIAGRIFAIDISSSDNLPIHRFYEYDPESGKWNIYQWKMENFRKVSFIGDYGGNICLADEDGSVLVYSLKSMEIIKKCQMKCLDQMSYVVLAEF